IRPVVQGNGQLVFAQPLASGHARLKGTIEWNRPNTDPRATATELRIWVNGFQQEPVALKREQGKQDFNALITVGEEKQNLINIDLSGAPLDSQSKIVFTVDCLKPQA